MGKPVTLLERLCEHTMSFGAHEFETERDEAGHKAYASIDGARTRVGNFESADARELHADLQKALKKPLRSVIVGAVYEIHVRAHDDRHCLVTIRSTPKLDPKIRPTLTAKQGQYLEHYFRVSAPSVHEMIRILERYGFIERTPRVARSIRVLVESKYLPELA